MATEPLEIVETHQAEQPQPTGAIDHARVNQLKEDMGEDFDGLIPIFIESVEEIINALEQAFSEKDTAVFSLHAHSLKSCTANLGCHYLSNLAASLEDQAKSGVMPESVNFIDELKSEFARIEIELGDMAA